MIISRTILLENNCGHKYPPLKLDSISTSILQTLTSGHPVNRFSMPNSTHQLQTYFTTHSQEPRQLSTLQLSKPQTRPETTKTFFTGWLKVPHLHKVYHPVSAMNYFVNTSQTCSYRLYYTTRSFFRYYCQSFLYGYYWRRFEDKFVLSVK